MSEFDCLQNRVAAWLANRALMLATPRYRRFVRNAIEYGMRAALRDNEQGAPPPPNWRPSGATPPFPAIEDHT